MYVGELLKNLDRVSTGVPGLDDLIGGGLIKGRVYLLIGPPGSGKTTFGIQFLIEGAKNDEKGLFVSLLEHPKTITQNMLRYNFGLLNYLKSKRIVFYDLGEGVFRAGRRFTWSEALDNLLSIVEGEGIKRVVIDSFTSLEHSVLDPDYKRIALGRFVRKLHDMGVTCLMTVEMMSSERYTDEYYLADGVIVLHHFMRDYRMIRALQVLKMHGVAHDTNLKKIRFTDEGLRVYPEAPF
ncbi:RAD55 family ATPase [Thermococcus celer]|uniref:Recombinase n=1 Tax=Thermococcus celer Vu 13 = JCM 8558 TaxID=1293037 RepID=A0A218P2S5_THECE|nr:ATPase domain-containing protein [Thermococcus celer]ASI99235.1 recombinase [Thermococcus celer] [Thermococcus celer Vu 13 = JCM 8558]